MVDELTTAPDVDAAVEAAKAATTPETFDFAAAVLDRDYPEDDVPVYLDEKKVKRMIDLVYEREELMNNIGNTQKPDVKQAKELDKLDKEYDKLVEELKTQKYVVKIKGIGPEEALVKEAEAVEKFPKEFTETTSPLTGAVTKTLVPNEERDDYHSFLLRTAHIVSVTNPAGAVDANFSDVEKVKAMWTRLPLVARTKIDQAINEATISVDYYRLLADEVF